MSVCSGYLESGCLDFGWSFCFLLSPWKFCRECSSLATLSVWCEYKPFCPNLIPNNRRIRLLQWFSVFLFLIARLWVLCIGQFFLNYFSHHVIGCVFPLIRRGHLFADLFRLRVGFRILWFRYIDLLLVFMVRRRGSKYYWCEILNPLNISKTYSNWFLI
jgi:hypothetical protein